MLKKEKWLLAEDIISKFLADQEMERREAIEKKKFFQSDQLNKARKFFDMPELPPCKHEWVLNYCTGVRNCRVCFKREFIPG